MSKLHSNSTNPIEVGSINNSQPNKQHSSSKPPDRLLAVWQTMLLWAIWLSVAILIWRSSEYRASFGGKELIALLTATTLTVIMKKNPLGIRKVILHQVKDLTGEFEIRINWPWVLVAAAITLGGIAMTIRLSYDLYYGHTTITGVFTDVFYTLLQRFRERASKNIYGGIVKTHLYILVLLLPIGLLLFLYHIRPYFSKIKQLRIDKDGFIFFKIKGELILLQELGYQAVIADGRNVHFYLKINSVPDDEATHEKGTKKIIYQMKKNIRENYRLKISLPQARVYSCRHETLITTQLIADFFREQLKAQGFIEKDEQIANASKDQFYMMKT